MNDDKDLEGMTGEKVYNRGEDTNEVSLNGDNGRFTYFNRNQERDATTGKYKHEPLDAGVTLKFDEKTGEKEIVETKPLKVVFLKIRRTLSHYHPEGGSMGTTEHNTKHDTVILYGPGKGEKHTGVAEQLRVTFDKLRTLQKVYAYFPERQEVVRVVAKGASLGSKVKDPNILKFYDYIQTFKKPDHFWEYFTEITPVPEMGPKGIYFAMSFKRGEKLKTEQLEKVKGLIREVHAQVQENDAKVAQRAGGTDKIEVADIPGADIREDDFGPSDTAIEYPAEDINPEDIPF